MSESAQKRGKKLLERFQEEKHSARKSSQQSTPTSQSQGRDPQDAYFDAIANGSLLGICYSETKKKDRSSTPKVGRSALNVADDIEDLEAESPLEMLRFALLQLSTLEDSSADKSPFNSITSLLQGVEEYLERSNSRMLTLSSTTPRKGGRINTKLGFSAERPSRRSSDPDDEILNQSTYTPIKADQSGYRTQRSIFMENQLDLNESEMEYYEQVVNDLAEKLERMQEEKDDLQSISNALGERLQRLGQQKEEALVQASKEFESRRLELEARVQELELSLAKKSQELLLESNKVNECESNLSILRAKIKDDEKKYLSNAEQNAALIAQVNKLNEEMQMLTNFQRDEQELAQIQRGNAEKNIEALQATINNLTKSRQELQERLNALEQDASDMTKVRQQLTDVRRSETDLRAQLAELRVKYEQTDEEHTRNMQALEEKNRHLQSELLRQQQQMQQRLSVAEAATVSSNKSTPFSSPSRAIGSGGSRMASDAEEEIAALKEKVEDLEAELEDNQREVDSLSSIIEDLRMKISASEQDSKPPGDSAQKRREISPRRFDASSFQYENDGDISVVRIAPSPFGKHIDRLNTSVHSQAGQREAHKVYMENQLDLNESELKYYEEVVNELANQLESVKAEVDQLSSERDSLLSENRDLQNAADDLSSALREREEEIAKSKEQIEDLQQLLSVNQRALQDTRPASRTVSKGSKTLPSPGDALTNEFLGISSGNDGSDSEGDVEVDPSVSLLGLHDSSAIFSAHKGRDPSASFDSFHSTAEHVYHRSDSHELRRIIKEREDQIKVQISQLQAQQDTLQDHRNAVEILKSQKQSLKKALSDATARVEALQNQEVELRNRVHQLEEQQQESTELVEDMRRRSTEAENLYEEAKLKVNDLLQVTTEYRLQIEHLQDQQQRGLMSGQKRIMSTPSPPTSAARSVQSSGGSRLHDSSSLQQRLRHAEAQVDELSMHIRVAEKAQEDAQLEFDKLQVRFQAKLRLAEEQNQDIMELRQEIDKLLEENDRIKLHEMQTETTCRLKEIDNQGEIELLQQRVRELEEENNKLIEVLRSRQLELQNEIDNNRSLKEIMNRVGQKDSSTEHMLLEVRAERDSVRKQLADVTEKLQLQARSVTEYHEQFTLLQTQLKHRDSEVMSMQKRIELLQGEAQGETRSLYLRLEDLSNENQSVEDALREQKQKTASIERELKARGSELENSRRSLRNLVDVVRAQYSKILNAQDFLAQTVQAKLSRVDARLESATYNVNDSLQSVSSVMNGTEQDRRLVEKALKDTQKLLQNALDQHDRDATEKDEIWAKYDAAHQEVEELKGMLDEVNSQLVDRIDAKNSQDAQAQVVQDEIRDIQQRLSEAELRAEQMSTESARAFAKSARTIAYLEGECTRLKTLLDHLRVVNVKLNGDLKNAHLEGMRCKSLEHRVKMSEQDEAALRKRIESLEAAMQQKEHDLLIALESARDQEEDRLERFESDYNTISAQYRALQEKNASLLQEHSALKERSQQETADHLAELDAFQIKLQNALRDASKHQTRTEELDFELRGLRQTLQETEHLYSQANTKITLLSEEMRVSKETHANTINELKNEVRDRTEANRLKEQQLLQLKEQVGRLESDFVQRDEEIAGKLLLRVAADDENRLLRNQLDAQSTDLSLMRGRIEDLQVQVASLTQQNESFKEQDAHIKAELQLTTIKLQESREISRKLSDDIEVLQEDCTRTKDSLRICRTDLSESETKLQELQGEFFSIQANEQALSSHNENLTEDNAYLRKQVDELVPKLSASSREVVSLRNQLNDQTELVLELRRESEEHEGRLLQIKSSFDAYEIAEADIVTEMREIADLLTSNVGVDPSAGVSGDSAGSESLPRKSKSGNFAIGMDLFASPPLAIVRSPLNLYSSTDGTDLTADLAASHSDVLSGIKYNISSLKCRANNLLSAYLKTFQSLEKTTKEKDELRKDFERAKEKIQLGSYERETIQEKLSRLEEEKEVLESQVEDLRQRNAAWASGHGALAQRMSSSLRELDNSLLESLAKANDAVAGIIPISTDALPNMRISDAVVQFDEARGRTSFNGLTPAKPPSEPDHHSSTAVLTVSISEVQRATEYLLGVIRNVVRECKHRADATSKMESAAETKEALWERDRKRLFEQQAELEDSISALQKQQAHLTAELESHKVQLDRANHRVEDVMEHNCTLESELADSLGQRNELKQDLARAEANCLDLRAKLRAAQSEVDKRTNDLDAVNEQFEEMQRRITEGELQHERTSSLLGRTRAEKEALDNVRRSLESELERSRAEVITLRECSKVVDDEHRSSFEVEKILAALSTTMDQIVATGGSVAVGTRQSALTNATIDITTENALMMHAAAGASVNSSFVSIDSHRGGAVHTSMQNQDIPLSTRVDAAVKRLSNLRHWSREEARAKRNLEGQLEAAGADAALAQSSAEEAQKQVKQLLAAASQRDRELKEKTANLLEREVEMGRLQEELHRLKTDGSSIYGKLEDEKKHGLTLIEQLATKEHEFARLTSELDCRAATVSKLQDELQSVNDQLAAALAESERRGEQLRSAKANSDRIRATLEQVERGAAIDKTERENAEKRCAEAEEQLASLTRLRARTVELEQKVADCKEDCKLANRAKVVAEEHNATLQQDLHSALKKVTNLEHRIESIMQEKNSFVDEVAETRKKIALAKQYADQERAQRMKADATMALLKRSGEESRLDLVEYATMAEEADSQQSRAEEEKRSLRSKINELKHMCEEKESMRQTELNDRKKMESDIKQLKAALAKRNAELASSSNYSAQLRTEGRHARQLVMHAVKHIREILTIVKKDAKSAGVDITSPDVGRTHRKGTSMTAADASTEVERGEKDPTEISYDDALTLGLGEALGINDLTHSLEALREAMVYISAAPVNRQSLQARLAQLESEHASILKELQISESKRTELVSRYKEEIQTMHLHITELRRTDSKNPHLMHQIAELEATVKVERERREKAQSEITALRSRLDQIARDPVPHHRNSDDRLQAELESMRSEFELYRTENAELVEELNAVNHHRTVLRDTIEQLDREVREKVDLLSDLQASAGVFPSSAGNLDNSFAAMAAGESEDGLHRQILRYKARASAVDDLATIYRTSVLALYSDGASYGAAQFGGNSAGSSNHGVQLIGVGWIEREMNAVKHSYEDEVRLLDSEVAELRSKLRQSNSYIQELQRRFEENMRSIYRSGKGSNNADIQPLEQMQRDMDAMHSEMNALQQEVASERVQGRGRHAHLIETLTAALQARDAALGALKRLEEFCNQRGVDIDGLAVYESLKADMANLNTATQNYDNRTALAHQKTHTSFNQHQQQVVDTLMRGLVEVDHELAESERRHRARQRAAATATAPATTNAVAPGNSSANHSRSTSRGSGSRNTYAYTQHKSSHQNAPLSSSQSTNHTAHERYHSPKNTRGTPVSSSLHHIRSSPSEKDRLMTEQLHEQRLTRDFISKNSPSSTPSAQQATASATQAHTHTLTTGSASHLLSTSQISHGTARLRTTSASTTAGTQRDSSFHLPVANIGAGGSGSLRVNRSSTPSTAQDVHRRSPSNSRGGHDSR